MTVAIKYFKDQEKLEAFQNTVQFLENHTQTMLDQLQHQIIPEQLSCTARTKIERITRTLLETVSDNVSVACPSLDSSEARQSLVKILQRVQFRQRLWQQMVKNLMAGKLTAHFKFPAS